MKKRFTIALILVLVVGLGYSLRFASSSIIHDSSLITVTGTLEAGVEAGCVLLRADDEAEYLLLGWSDYPPLGTRVAVTGYLESNVASYCMQGNAVMRVVSLFVLSATTSQSVSYGTATASSATVITGSTAQSTTVTGERVTIGGYLYEVVETPLCRPQCGAPSFILAYLYVPEGTGCTGSMGCFPPPRYYRLMNMDGTFFQSTAPNGTYATVTGIVVTPSSWNCESFYAPKICMTGDIYVQTIVYGTLSQSQTGSFTTTTSQRDARGVPIPGFELPSILVGLLLGLTIIVVGKYKRIPRQ